MVLNNFQRLTKRAIFKMHCSRYFGSEFLGYVAFTKSADRNFTVIKKKTEKDKYEMIKIQLIM